VPDDHRVRGIEHYQDRLGGFIANVLVSDVVDEPLLKQLQNAGLVSRKRKRDSDALHLMYAIHHHCNWFVTLDLKDFRKDVAPLCRGLSIVTPSELAAELAGIPKGIEPDI
jgi:hypothetical protein